MTKSDHNYDRSFCFTMIWNPILKNNDVITGIQDKINEITSTILHNLSNESSSLSDGKAGLFLYFAYLSKHEKTDKYNAVIVQLIEECFDAINNGQFNNTSFCTGISGFLWALHHLKSEGVIDIDDHFEALTALLVNHADRLGADDNFDYLHGASGIALYLSHIHPHINNNYIDTFVNHLKNKGIEDELTVKWTSYMYNDNNKPVYNLSLSHGISSIIIILCTLQQYAPENKDIKILVKKAVHFLRTQKKEPKNINDSLFPSYVSDHGDKTSSRLSWCYGDIGNALALLNAGNLLNEKQLIDEALQIMSYNANRKDLEKAHILDAGICHGAAGIAHIFNRFYQQTQNEVYRNTALYWLQITLNMSTFKDGLAGYKAHKGIEDGYINSIGLLDGIVGIGMVLMAAISNIEPGWDRAFLLS